MYLYTYQMASCFLSTHAPTGTVSGKDKKNLEPISDMTTNSETTNSSLKDYDLEILEHGIISGARWFFWISLLSLGNIIFMLFHAH